MEDPRFLTEQIITYIGNKRALLRFIATALDDVKRELGADKLDTADLFSGSGIVSRFLKQHSRVMYVNDLEDYCETLNRCYLTNIGDININELTHYHEDITRTLDEGGLCRGFISEMYSPKDDNDIKIGERVFFTARNAMYIDTARKLMDKVPEEYRPYLLAPLLYEASVHNNTGGVFKGFYKNSETGIGQFGGNGRNALSRITADIRLPFPVFGRYSCEVNVYKEDANELARKLGGLDLVYLDPPYNQHPYGSNYFMLNLINNYEKPREISRISGIPKGWNKSAYNRRHDAKECMYDLCRTVDAKYLLISFNSEGFIPKKEMTELLEDIGQVRVYDTKYNTFRASRNLAARDIHVREYLYLVRKR